VSTIAGGLEDAAAQDGSPSIARFSRPTDVACDGAGHLFVADADNAAIRRITLAGGAVDTVAGALGAKGNMPGAGMAARFWSPQVLALAGSTLYVWDNGDLKRVRLSDFDVATVSAGAGPAYITGLTADAGGNVYFTSPDMVVRQIASDGTVSTLAGSTSFHPTDGTGSSAGFAGPSGVVFDGSSSLYVAETGGCLRRITLPAAVVTTPLGQCFFNATLTGVGTGATVLQPHAILFDGMNGLLVGDDGGHTIDRIDVATGTLSIVAGVPPPAFGGSSDGPLASALLDAQSGFALDANGALFFSDWIGDTVRRFAGGRIDTLAGLISTGKPTDGTQDGIGMDARFHSPEGLALDGAGHLYVADSWNHAIRRVDLATNEVTTFAGVSGTQGAADGVGDQARFNLPMDLIYDGGSLYVADSGNAAIRRIDATTREVTTFIGTLGVKGVAPGALPARLNTPRGLVLMGPGHIGFIDEQAVLEVR
jgi:DNA-binding beta-propeller fold protein YncE